jgi:hypothetical protein
MWAKMLVPSEAKTGFIARALAEGKWLCYKLLVRLFPILPLVAFLVPGAAAATGQDRPVERERMVLSVANLVATSGARAGREIRPSILDALRRVPRHLFVPEGARGAAYEDRPLPIGHGATISAPSIVALMTELLDPRPDQSVLEIGTGSGYQAAILSTLVREVRSIEIVEELARSARESWPRWATATSRSGSATAMPAGPKRRRSTGSSSPPRRRTSHKCSSTSSGPAGAWSSRSEGAKASS